MQTSQNSENIEYYYEKSNLVGYAYSFSFLALTIGAVIGIANSTHPAFTVLFVLLLGFLQAWFNQGKHEFLHDTVLTHGWANRAFWYVFSIPILVNPNLNRDFHLWHHRYLGTEKDPELLFDVRKGYQIHEVLLRKLFRPFVIDLFLANVRALFGRYPTYAVHGSKIRLDAALLLLTHVSFIGALVVTGNWMYAAIWYGTMEYVGFNILCVYDIAEHRWCAVTDPQNSSRTCVSNPFIWYMTWCNNFHSVHHLDTNERCVTFYKRKSMFENRNFTKSAVVEKGYAALLRNMYATPEKY